MAMFSVVCTPSVILGSRVSHISSPMEPSSVGFRPGLAAGEAKEDCGTKDRAQLRNHAQGTTPKFSRSADSITNGEQKNITKSSKWQPVENKSGSSSAARFFGKRNHEYLAPCKNIGIP